MPPPSAEDDESKNWFNGLSFRVAVFLSLALLPLGLMAVLQTRDLTREVRSRSELSLIALTEAAGLSERQLIERGIGAAEALSAVLRMIRENPEACTTYLREYLNSTQRYFYVGFVPTDGIVQCASNTRSVDFSQEPVFQSLIENPRQLVAPLSKPWDPSGSAVVFYHPVMQDQELLGYTVVSVQPDRLRRQEDFAEQRHPYELMTINAEAQVLTAENPEQAGLAELPAGTDLARLAEQPSRTFFDKNQAGETRLYVHTEIVPGIAYALGVWELTDGAQSRLGLTVPTSLFPLLMWLASLAVSIFAVHRLAVRHLQKLSARMRRFAIDRQIPTQPPDPSWPFEIRQLETSFQSMAYALVADEARMEDTLREKNVLLKEVHHRVKNNLQMISSIMNMKIRKSESAETKSTIRRLQERVLGLATVHRNLYQTEDLSKTNAGALLREIFTQLLSAKKAQGASRMKVTMELDDIIMFPDQAVPFSLLASEIATNSLDHAGSDDGDPWIRFVFKTVEPGVVRLECRNSVGPRSYRQDDGDHGLGAQLIKAFSMQLSASYEVEAAPTEYAVRVTFAVQDFKPDVLDY